MRLVSMEIMDTKTQKMVTRSLTNVPFVEVIRELETQTSIGQQGITPYHMKFEPDLDDTAVSRLSSSKFFRFESKHNKEVIDAIEAIDRGTERCVGDSVQRWLIVTIMLQMCYFAQERRAWSLQIRGA